MKLFAFGIGYSVEAYLRSHGADWTRIAGTVRSADKAERLARDIRGLETFVFDGATANPGLISRLDSSDALLVSIPPRGGDPVLGHLRRVIERSSIGRIVYLSTIGVYGGEHGEWVDETTPPAAHLERAAARIEAEKGWMALGGPGRQIFVLRLAGIYGPGRNALENMLDGAAKRIVRPGQVFNRIHTADIAQTIAACFVSDCGGGVFNVCDDEPAPPQDVVTFAARLLRLEPPRETAFEDAQLSPMARSFWATNKRVANRKLRETLGVDLLYPTYREGLTALAHERPGG